VHSWVEESLCEVASLYALIAISKRLPNEAASRVFRNCATANADDHTELRGEPFAKWLARTRPALDANCYRRKDNTLIALHLLPIFESSPEAWSAVRHLGLWPADSRLEYFAAWRSVTPSRLHGVIDRVQALLDFSG
jgi:hypothetical protein